MLECTRLIFPHAKQNDLRQYLTENSNFQSSVCQMKCIAKHVSTPVTLHYEYICQAEIKQTMFAAINQ